MKKGSLIAIVAGALVILLAGGYFGARFIDQYQTRNQSTPPPEWTSSQSAARDSVEGQLRRAGKTWVKTSGEITVGSYVQDVLEGRLNQPVGRGAIGKVVAVSEAGAPGPKAATVDFGRGYKPGIQFSELSLVNVVSK